MGRGNQDIEVRKEIKQASGVRGDWKIKLTTVDEFKQMLLKLRASDQSNTFLTEEKIKDITMLIHIKEHHDEFEVFCINCNCKLYSVDPDLMNFRQFKGVTCPTKQQCQDQRRLQRQ